MYDYNSYRTWIQNEDGTYTLSFADKSRSKAASSQYKGSMQERFAQFRKKKLRNARLRKFVVGRRSKDPQHKQKLRTKFIKQVKSYIGVPYAQKYHEAGTEDYDSPLFLDCCALIRRSVNDLSEDFGFTLARWNQNYQYSTLQNSQVDCVDPE